MTWHSRIHCAIRRLIGAGAWAQLRAFDGSSALSVAGVTGIGASAAISHPRLCERSSGSHRSLARLSLFGVVACLAFAGAAGGASATLIHKFEFSFNGGGTAAQLTGPGDVAFNAANGELWVSDGTGVVDEFGADGTYAGVQITGTPAGPFSRNQDGGIAVDNSAGPNAGDVYVADTGNGVVDRFDSAGNFLCQITGSATPSATECNGGAGSATPAGSMTPKGLAVDPNGDLYVADPGNDVIDEFGPSGNYLGQISDNYGGSPYRVAVDPSGDVYVTNELQSTVEFGPSGAFLRTVDTNPGFAPTVDPTSGNVDVTDTSPQGQSEISQYDSSGDLLNTFGYPQLGQYVTGIAVRPSTGEVYAADFSNSQIDVFSAQTVPDVSTGQASEVSSTAEMLTGTVNPDGTTLSASGGCQFEYVDAADYNSAASDPYSAGQTVPCSSTPSGSSSVGVSASVSRLTLGTVYHYRLEAANANGANYGADQTFVIGQTIDSQSAGGATDSGVTLTAQINPQGNDTTYQFQYGPTTNYGTSVPATAADIGAGSSDVSVSQTVSGLPAGTEYHWRVVATSALGTVDGADQIFATNAAPGPASTGCSNGEFRSGYGAHLPDCRAYEQVTPVNKDGVNPYGLIEGGDFAQAAGDGHGITYISSSGMPGGVGSQAEPIFLATRGADGWSSEGLDPPESDGLYATVLGWSPDLAWSLSTANTPEPGAFYLEGDAAGTFTSIAPNPATGSSPTLDGIASGGSEVVFDDNASLTGSAAGAGNDNVYAWDATTGDLSLASVLPDGTTPSSGVQGEAVSTDGSAVVFGAAADEGTDNGTNQLFLRENPTAADAATVEVSASQKTNGSGPGGSDPNGPQQPTFLKATPSASAVLFSSAAELTNDANTGSADQGSDLYEYAPSSGGLTDLSVPDAGTTNTDPNGAEVQGILGASDDGSYVYFVANGVLAPGASQGYCSTAVVNSASGGCSLYLWHDGTITFIARLQAGDPTNNGDIWDAPDWNGAGAARVTPDGQTLLFSSFEPLTGYDNVTTGTHCGEAGEGGSDTCAELYVYKAATGSIVCVSCDPSGAAPLGNASELSGFAVASPPNVSNFVTRNLSDSGDQVFFESPDPLLPQDNNGQQDVYEWEAEGAGSCHGSSDSGGCLYSISSGQSSQADHFADASANGSDVFFFTYSQLVGQDQDQIEDIYDARVDGGMTSQWPTTPTACTSSATCQGTGTTPSGPPTIATVTFSGPPDPTSTRTGAGKVRVTRKTVKGTRFVIAVKVPSKGRITLAGADVAKVSRAVQRARVYRLTVRLTAKARRRLKHERRLRVRLRVSYAPQAGAGSSVAISMTVRAR